MLLAQWIVAAIVVALILKFGFGAAALLLVVIAALYVLAAIAVPIFVHAKLRVSEKPVVQQVWPDDTSIPEAARVQLESNRDAFAGLDFEPRGLIQQPVASGASTYLELYRHRDSSARALARVVLKSGRGASVIHSSEVEFEIRYDDNTSVELSNIATQIPGLELMPAKIGQMPQIQDVARLFDYFLKFVARHESETGRSPHRRVPLPDDASQTSLYYEQLQRAYGIQHRGGLLQPSGDPGVWRPTWRMTLKLASAMISPGLEFTKRRLNAQGERLRRALDGDPTRPFSERIGSRIGWIMLAVGLPLSAIAVIMSPASASVVFLGIILAQWIAKRRAKRTGREPGWRAIVAGGLAAALLVGLPIAVPYSYPLGLPPQPMSAMLMGVGLFVIPMLLLITAAVLIVEGFRAAAT